MTLFLVPTGLPTGPPTGLPLGAGSMVNVDLHSSSPGRAGLAGFGWLRLAGWLPCFLGFLDSTVDLNLARLRFDFGLIWLSFNRILIGFGFDLALVWAGFRWIWLHFGLLWL